MEERLAFCPSCGGPLRDSDTFCTECGAKIGESHVATSPNTQSTTSKKSRMLWVIIILGILWAAAGIILGAETLINAKAQIENILTPELLEQLDILNFDIDMLVTIVQVTGAVFIISGIMAAMTSVLAYLRRYHSVALILCIIGSVLALISLIGIAGLIVAYYLSKSKGEFIPSALK